MKIYLAARYARKSDMQAAATVLTLKGHDVVSSWLKEQYTDSSVVPAYTLGVLAQKDIDDLLSADCLLSFTELPCPHCATVQPVSVFPSLHLANGTGGRHVEFGIALLRKIRCAVIGPREHVFHFLPQVEVYDSLASFLRALKKEEYK